VFPLLHKPAPIDMLDDKEKWKQFLVKIYFPKMNAQNIENLTLYLQKKERKFLKSLHLPERFCASYYLIVNQGELKDQCKIEHKDKDSLKYFLKLIGDNRK